MSEEYVSRVTLEINSQVVDDFLSIEEGEYELRRSFALMNKSGFTRTTPRYPLALEYVIPKNKPEMNFDDIEGATITVDYLNGVRKTYTGVACLKVGAVRHVTEKESVRTIDFIATGRIEN